MVHNNSAESHLAISLSCSVGQQLIANFNWNYNNFGDYNCMISS